MGARRKGREAALQMLYQMDASGQPGAEVVRLFWLHLGHGQEGEEFANELLLGCEREAERVDAAIRAVSENWRMERMARVDRNILRLGCYELLFIPEVPRRVTLNEAIELAKRFGSEGSASFVNGVLDRLASDASKD